jgi:hypothetical protein
LDGSNCFGYSQRLSTNNKERLDWRNVGKIFKGLTELLDCIIDRLASHE